MAPSVPDTLEEVMDPAWLSSALGRRFPGVAVASVLNLGRSWRGCPRTLDFTSSTEGPSPSALPTDLCVKGYFADCSDTAAASRTAGVPEALFYRHLADLTGVRTLECVYADVDPVTQHGVVITEDVVAHGATFLDALSPYAADQVAESLEQYAILHGRTWARAEPSDEPWLAPRLEATMSARGLPEISGNFEGADRVSGARGGARRRTPPDGRPSTDTCCWTGPSHDACSTVTRTSETSTSMRQDTRASWTGSSSSVARGTSTWATTSAAH